jgi:hypothetical protein
MKLNCILTAATLVVAGLLSTKVSAQIITYNTTQTAINGSGNTDSGWSVYSSPNLTLATMAQYNYPGYPNNATAPSDPNNGAGTFLFPTGPKPGKPTRGQFDIWFSVYTPNSSLAASALDFYWSVTTTGPGTAFGPINLSLYTDSSYGNVSTPNSGGTVGTFAAMAGANSLFQNAQDPSWLISGYDPNANQIITVDLFAIAQGADPNIATKVGNLVSTIQVGAVPEPAAVALIGFGGLVSLLAVRRRRKSP